MSCPSVFLHHLRATPGGLSVAQFLALQPGVARRSAQRQLADMVAQGLIQPEGEGRGRRYRALALNAYAAPPPSSCACGARKRGAIAIGASEFVSRQP